MNFFSYEYDPQVMFDMYTSMHVLMLGIFAFIMVLFFVFKNKLFHSKHEKTIRYAYATFLLIVLITLAIIETAGGVPYLPFHLCSISFILTIVLLYTNNKKVYYFLFFTGIIGGLVSFAIPDLYHAGYNRFRFYEFIIAHSSIIFVPIYYLTCYKWKIDIKTALYVMLVTNILGFLMLPVNLLLRSTGFEEHANYMFTMGPPEDVESVFGTFPWHILSFELVLLVTFGLLYLAVRKYQNKNG